VAYKVARSSANKDDVGREVRGAIGERVACIVGNRGIVRGGIDREFAFYCKRESAVVCNRIMCNTVQGGILEGNDHAEERSMRSWLEQEKRQVLTC